MPARREREKEKRNDCFLVSFGKVKCNRLTKLFCFREFERNEK